MNTLLEKQHMREIKAYLKKTSLPNYSERILDTASVVDIRNIFNHIFKKIEKIPFAVNRKERQILKLLETFKCPYNLSMKEFINPAGVDARKKLTKIFIWFINAQKTETNCIGKLRSLPYMVQIKKFCNFVKSKKHFKEQDFINFLGVHEEFEYNEEEVLCSKLEDMDKKIVFYTQKENVLKRLESDKRQIESEHDIMDSENIIRKGTCIENEHILNRLYTEIEFKKSEIARVTETADNYCENSFSQIFSVDEQSRAFSRDFEYENCNLEPVQILNKKLRDTAESNVKMRKLITEAVMLYNEEVFKIKPEDVVDCEFESLHLELEYNPELGNFEVQFLESYTNMWRDSNRKNYSIMVDLMSQYVRLIKLKEFKAKNQIFNQKVASSLKLLNSFIINDYDEIVDEYFESVQVEKDRCAYIFDQFLD